MSETTAVQPASIGKPERLNATIPADNGEGQAQTTDDNTGAGQSEEDKNKEAEALKLAEAEKNKLPELNDDQLREILKGRGVEFESFDTLKESLKPKGAAPTEEEKAKAIADFEKRQLDLFLTTPGASVEGFAAMKNLLNATDLKELSITEIRQSMKGKFDESQIDAVIEERYYQKHPDELPQGDTETDDEFDKRKEDFKKLHEYGTEKLTARGQAIKDKATNFFKTLETAIKQSDLSKRDTEEHEREILSKTDEYLSKVPKKITFELGKAPDGADISPVLYDVDDADIAEVSRLLKDSTQRNNILLTPDGKLNVESIASILLENANLKRSQKAIYLEGGSRQVEIFEKTFPHRTAQSVGLNGNTKSKTVVPEKGQPVSAGKTQRVPQGQ